MANLTTIESISMVNPPITSLAPRIAESHVSEPPQIMFSKHPSKPHLSGMSASLPKLPEVYLLTGEGLGEYHELYHESITKPNQFWGRLARKLLSWERDFKTVHSGSLLNGENTWFCEGELNASYNCVDRHALKDPEKPAIMFEADETSDSRTITYGELLKQVCRTAHVLRQLGVKKGDTVSIYLPMIPEAAFAILACTRLGAIHSVIFAGFSSSSIADRINDAKSRIVITSNEGVRGGKPIATKYHVDEALKNCPHVTHCLVFRRTSTEIPWTPGRDFWWHKEAENSPSYISPVSMNSEDPLFLLYTSGSTGKPKGIVHSTAGYLVGAAATGKYVFDIHDSDKIFCAGDVGWITGHTYVIYAPLLLGVATIIFEGNPVYPTPSRYWEVIHKYEITQFYVAPTALRVLKRSGDHLVQPNGTHLRVLGSVGEPISADVWQWYHEIVGKTEAHVIDTYWQTETGSHAIAPLAGVTPTKPGSATLPFFGIEPAIINAISGEEISEVNKEGTLAFKQPWPSMARTIWGDHTRYMNTYLNVFKGYYASFTGDSARRDKDGYYWICGRVDDVINVSGHRISTAEIEAALILHPAVVDAAAVGISHEITGQAIVAFVSIKTGSENQELLKDLILQVRKIIGPFAAPKTIYIVPDLPKTRSGKIMRRILRKIVAGEEDELGDISTLSNPSVVEIIIRQVCGI